uniref:Uncharacterized protein n=1 Tax=Nelumbo nucifera TaxID=4432 RepID=A0A822ZCG0_NELNU|nr:TPA_asm: hypothetical protein HUJ06_015458 [Nelumbo nucifera]
MRADLRTMHPFLRSVREKNRGKSENDASLPQICSSNGNKMVHI